MALPSRDECRAALRGFALLLRGEARAVAFYDLSVEGVWRSFWPGLLLTLPYVLLLPAADPAIPADAAALAGQFLLQIAVWFVYLAAMMVFGRAFGLTARYAVFVVLYNWGQAVLLLATLPVLGLTAAGLLPAGVPDGWAGMLLLLWLYAVTRMARIGLGAPLGIALLAAVLDPAVTVLLHRMVDLIL
jgi:hypothetical protein